MKELFRFAVLAGLTLLLPLGTAAFGQPLILPAQFEEEQPEDARPDYSQAELPAREQLQNQVEQNQQVMDNLFQLLDGLQGNLEATAPVEKQIQALEAVNQDLYYQLEEWDRRDFIAAYQSELEEAAKTLQNRLKQGGPDSQGLQRKLLEEELALLKLKLQDDAWKADAEKVWNRQHQDPVEVLNEELETLQRENKLLRLEMQQMSDQLREMHALLKKLAEKQ